MYPHPLLPPPCLFPGCAWSGHDISANVGNVCGTCVADMRFFSSFLFFFILFSLDFHVCMKCTRHTPRAHPHNTHTPHSAGRGGIGYIHLHCHSRSDCRGDFWEVRVSVSLPKPTSHSLPYIPVSPSLPVPPSHFSLPGCLSPSLPRMFSLSLAHSLWGLLFPRSRKQSLLSPPHTHTCMHTHTRRSIVSKYLSLVAGFFGFVVLSSSFHQPH